MTPFPATKLINPLISVEIIIPKKQNLTQRQGQEYILIQKTKEWRNRKQEYEEEADPISYSASFRWRCIFEAYFAQNSYLY